MADIKLGLPGLEIVLPAIKFEPGSDPEIPTECQKNVREATMSDGSSIFNISAVHPKSFRLPFDELTAAEVAVLLGILALDEELSFINEYVSADAYRVVVTDFTGPDPIGDTTGQAEILYRMTINLKGTGTVV